MQRDEPTRDDELEAARELIARAERVVILTGAGISAESGVPTFRSGNGLWRNYRVEELATPEAFARDPRTVWEWYAWRRGEIAACRPNAAHLACARFAMARPGVTIVTQNVDGLHAEAARIAAGAAAPDAAMPIELHGSIARTRCHDCAAESDPGAIETTSEQSLPRCGCGGLLRPAVVWFGELLPAAAIERAYAEAARADVALVIGTSAVVYPAAGVALATLQAGGAMIEVNPEETPFTRLAAVSVRAPAAMTLGAMLEGK